MSSAQCDFCSAPEIKWSYPCRDFVMQMVPGMPGGASAGSWGACSACYSLIERGDRAGLAKRSAKKMVKKHPGLPLKLALQACRNSHDGFFAHREGPPVAAERGQPDPALANSPVAPQHRLGPDAGELARVLSIPSQSIRAMREVGHETLVYFEDEDEMMYVAAVRLAGERDYVRASKEQALGGRWDHLRFAIEAGAV